MTDRGADPIETGTGQEWYADGLRFECTQCGNCCTGPPGYVWFTEAEGRAMAGALGVDEDRFFEEFAHRVLGRWTLNEHETEHGFDCVLLDRETSPGKALCTVYKARPTQCRTWPFWPENISSRREWRDVKRNTPCPGIDQGSLIPIEQIRIQRDQS